MLLNIQIEFYEDKTFTKNKGDYEYSQLTRMIQIEDLKVLVGSKENPLKKYYVLYAPDFRKYVHQEIIIINRYTLEAKFIMDYRFFQNSEPKMKELRNLTDELIEKKYISKSLLDNKEYEIHKFKPMPWDYQCEIIEKLNKLL